LEVFFWQLANNEVSSAISVFILSDEIDRGHLIAQQEFLIVPGETVRSLYLKIVNLTSDVLANTIRIVLENKKITPIVNSHEKSSYFPMPTRSSYKKFKKAKKRWT
jgi:methionyl-tRNA formyltransferase